MIVRKDTSGNVVRAVLARQGETAKKLSQRTGIAEATISRKLRCPATLTVGDIRKMDAALAFSDEELLELVRGK